MARPIFLFRPDIDQQRAGFFVNQGQCLISRDQTRGDIDIRLAGAALLISRACRPDRCRVVVVVAALAELPVVVVSPPAGKVVPDWLVGDDGAEQAAKIRLVDKRPAMMSSIRRRLA